MDKNEQAATWPELAPAAPAVAGEGRHSMATNAWYGYPSDTNTPPDTAPADETGPRVVVGTDPATGTTATMLHDPVKDTFTVLEMKQPEQWQQDYMDAILKADSPLLKPRSMGETAARKLSSLYAELTAKPAKQKRGNPIREWRDAKQRGFIAEYGTGVDVFEIGDDELLELADLLDKQKRGKWRKRAERWKERCKGVGSELSKAHDWIDSLEAKLIAAEQQRDAARAEADTLRGELERLSGEVYQMKCAISTAFREPGIAKGVLLPYVLPPDPPPAAPATDPACGCPADPEFDAYMSSPEAREDAAGLAEELAAAGPLDPAGYREGQGAQWTVEYDDSATASDLRWIVLCNGYTVAGFVTDERAEAYIAQQPAHGWQQEGE